MKKKINDVEIPETSPEISGPVLANWNLQMHFCLDDEKTMCLEFWQSWQFL